MNAPAMGLIPCHTPRRTSQSNGLAEAFFGSFKRDYVSQACLETVEDVARHSWGESNTTITRPRTAPWGCSRQPSAMRSGESETRLDLSKIRWGSTVGAQHEGHSILARWRIVGGFVTRRNSRRTKCK
jgi:transposase InsO family protein